MYCVYITTYSGDKLPKYYVGSSSVDNVKNGYTGSVKSKRWKALWESENRDNPELFHVDIISTHNTREEALAAELLFQTENNVVMSDSWANLSLATVNGFFGRDVSGENNPMFGKSRKGEIHNNGENISSGLKKFYSTEEGIKKRERSRQRLSENNMSKDAEIISRNKEIWKEQGRNIGSKNGMFGKKNPMNGKVLYNNGSETKAFFECTEPEGWIRGRHKRRNYDGTNQ